ncbi:MAG: TIGR00730 family Rossman fold protein, partial [Gemmatimonadales bacterium]|nr:TIGR00730 family Rossman fold protein [Gemmatimonadales bacterium]
MSKALGFNRICVFCGTNPGSRPEYGAAARGLGKLLADEEIELVYGGASVGIMGELADAVHEGGGHVTGIIPQQLMKKEAAHTGIPDLIVVASMHQRKSQMADMADGFIALPGGIGTLEGFFEILTWGQLGIHNKPCGVLNVSGYFDSLTGFLDHAVAEGFLTAEHRRM